MQHGARISEPCRGSENKSLQQEMQRDLNNSEQSCSCDQLYLPMIIPGK